MDPNPFDTPGMDPFAVLDKAMESLVNEEDSNDEDAENDDLAEVDVEHRPEDRRTFAVESDGSHIMAHEESEEAGLADEDWWRSDNIPVEEETASVAISQRDQPINASVFDVVSPTSVLEVTKQTAQKTSQGPKKKALDTESAKEGGGVEVQEKEKNEEQEEDVVVVVDGHGAGEGDVEEGAGEGAEEEDSGGGGDEGGGELAEEDWWRSDNVSTEEAAASVAVAQMDRPFDASVFGDAPSTQQVGGSPTGTDGDTPFGADVGSSSADDDTPIGADGSSSAGGDTPIGSGHLHMRTNSSGSVVSVGDGSNVSVGDGSNVSVGDGSKALAESSGTNGNESNGFINAHSSSPVSPLATEEEILDEGVDGGVAKEMAEDAGKEDAGKEDEGKATKMGEEALTAKEAQYEALLAAVKEKEAEHAASMAKALQEANEQHAAEIQALEEGHAATMEEMDGLTAEYTNTMEAAVAEAEECVVALKAEMTLKEAEHAAVVETAVQAAVQAAMAAKEIEHVAAMEEVVGAVEAKEHAHTAALGAKEAELVAAVEASAEAALKVEASEEALQAREVAHAAAIEEAGVAKDAEHATAHRNLQQDIEAKEAVHAAAMAAALEQAGEEHAAAMQAAAALASPTATAGQHRMLRVDTALQGQETLELSTPREIPGLDMQGMSTLGSDIQGLITPPHSPLGMEKVLKEVHEQHAAEIRALEEAHAAMVEEVVQQELEEHRAALVLCSSEELVGLQAEHAAMSKLVLDRTTMQSPRPGLQRSTAIVVVEDSGVRSIDRGSGKKKNVITKAAPPPPVPRRPSGLVLSDGTVVAAGAVGSAGAATPPDMAGGNALLEAALHASKGSVDGSNEASDTCATCLVLNAQLVQVQEQRDGALNAAKHAKEERDDAVNQVIEAKMSLVLSQELVSTGGGGGGQRSPVMSPMVLSPKVRKGSWPSIVSSPKEGSPKSTRKKSWSSPSKLKGEILQQHATSLEESLAAKESALEAAQTGWLVARILCLICNRRLILTILIAICMPTSIVSLQGGDANEGAHAETGGGSSRRGACSGIGPKSRRARGGGGACGSGEGGAGGGSV
jgi:hypothetical protein